MRYAETSHERRLNDLNDADIGPESVAITVESIGCVSASYVSLPNRSWMITYLARSRKLPPR